MEKKISKDWNCFVEIEINKMWMEVMVGLLDDDEQHYSKFT